MRPVFLFLVVVWRIFSLQSENGKGYALLSIVRQGMHMVSVGCVWLEASPSLLLRHRAGFTLLKAWGKRRFST